MGKLIYSMNVSLDGFIETPDHSLDWANVDEEVHFWFNQQTRGLGRLDLRPADVRGHDLVLADCRHRPERDSGDAPVRRDLERAPEVRVLADARVRRLRLPARHGDVGEVLAKLRDELDGEIDVSGPNIAWQFIERGLVDEYRLVVHPVAIGAGTPFFPPPRDRAQPAPGGDQTLRRLASSP